MDVFIKFTASLMFGGRSDFCFHGKNLCRPVLPQGTGPYLLAVG